MLVGPVPTFPGEIEEGIDEYLALQAELQASREQPPLPALTPTTAAERDP
jgi:hypothetical protein